MKAAQMKIASVEDDADAKARQQELEAMGDNHAVRLEQLFAACRKVVREMTSDVVADDLDRMWANRGRGVTSNVIRASLGDSRGNYFRLEWILYFAEHSEEVRQLLMSVAIGDAPKEAKDELADLQDLVREHLPKHADQLIRKAKAPRVRRGVG